jgi:hypothetical protein
VDNVEQSESSWLWTSCRDGNRYTQYDLEVALSTAVVQAVVMANDTFDDLILCMDELKLSVMCNPVDISNEYQILKASLADLLSEQSADYK